MSQFINIKKKIIIIQPTVPSYRINFFNALYTLYGDEFKVYASFQDMGVLTQDSCELSWMIRLGSINSIFYGIQWQSGAVGIPLSRGDILVVFGSPRCLSNIGLLIKARIFGAKTIWWGHFRSSTSKPWRTRLRLFIARLAHVLLFYTDREIGEYYQFVGRGANKFVFALNNGIDNNLIRRLRAVYDPKFRFKKLLYIGRITRKSNLPLLLRALGEPECKGVELEIIGDGSEKESAKKLVKSLSIDSRVKWHYPTTDEEYIAKVANSCALFVYPGSVGLSLIHGLCYGLPAIVHNDRWEHMPEISILENVKNGLFFRKNDVRSLAETIADALKKENQLITMSAEAIAVTDRSFNVDDMKNRFAKVIGTLRD